MRIGILGAGQVGGRLGRIWAQAGHKVVLGEPDPGAERFSDLIASLPAPARLATVAEAARGAEVLLLATPWSSARVAIEAAGELNGSIVIDCINPLSSDLQSLVIPPGLSTAEQISEWAPRARVVKAFNTTAAGSLGDASFAGTPLPGFYCGDDAAAKASVRELIALAGLEPIDVGALDKARMLEAHALFYIHLVVGCGLGGDVALGLVRRGP